MNDFFDEFEKTTGGENFRIRDDDDVQSTTCTGTTTISRSSDVFRSTCVMTTFYIDVYGGVRSRHNQAMRGEESR